MFLAVGIYCIGLSSKFFPKILFGSFVTLQVNGMPITVGVGNVISEEGFSLLMSPAAAGSVWKTLLSQGAISMGSNAWEKLRVLQGEKCFSIFSAYQFLPAHYMVFGS